MREVSFIRAVSSVVARSRDSTWAMEQIADLLIELTGVVGVEFPGVNLSSGSDAGQMVATATAAVSSDGRNHGEVKIRFQLQALTVQSPIGLARFVGQQLGLVLSSAELEGRNRTLAWEVESLKEDLRLRKVFDRPVESWRVNRGFRPTMPEPCCVPIVAGLGGRSSTLPRRLSAHRGYI